MWPVAFAIVGSVAILTLGFCFLVWTVHKNVQGTEKDEP